jgi:hypothetical protein
MSANASTGKYWLDRSEAGAEASRAEAQKGSPAAAKGETHASNGWPWKATLGLRAAGTAKRNGFTAARNMTSRDHPASEEFTSPSLILLAFTPQPIALAVYAFPLPIEP